MTVKVTSDTRSPVRASAVRWRQASGDWCLTVLAKTSYQLRSGHCPIATEQLSVLTRDRFYSATSDNVYAPADEVPLKLRTDVVLVGSAFAPRGTTSLQLTTRLRLGDVDKRVEVSCER